MMKTILIQLALVSAAGLVLASPLNQRQVAGDAQWLVHLDVDQVRTSSIGAYGIEYAKAIVSAEMGPIRVKIDALLEEVRSITAYGSSFEDDAAEKSVLLISAGEKARAMIEGYIAHEELTTGEGAMVQELSNQTYRTYLIAGEVYLAFPRPQSILISKSLKRIDEALRVMDGQAANLTTTQTALVLHEQAGFFLIASLQGLDTIPDMPPQARILSKATGGQVALGEAGGALNARLVLTTSTDEIATQLSRILQGMVALASFVELDGYGLDTLINNIRVQPGTKQVQLSLAYPSDEVIRLIELIENRAANR